MVNRKGYRYDAEGDRVTWTEGDQEQTYSYNEEKKQNKSEQTTPRKPSD